MLLDLGGGPDPRPGWVNLDPLYGEGEWKREAQDTPWPVKNGGVNGIRASHVLEHIPSGAPRLAVFQEAHRVLKPGGVFFIWVPQFPHVEAISDPTHVSFWVEDSFRYFEGSTPMLYGLSPWHIVSLESNGSEIQCEFRRP